MDKAGHTGSLTQSGEVKSFQEALRAFLHPRVVTMLFLGFSAGLPLLLIFSSLSLWLSEAGVDRSVVTMFSWAALGYSFKFVWAPLVDCLSIPLLTRILGRRRSWILLAQGMIILSIILISSMDPALGPSSINGLAAAAVLLGFSSATQDIVVDAYRIESADPSLQALMSSTYIAGYRIGMLVAGAGALYLATYFGSSEGLYLFDAWQNTYLVMAGFMGVGVVTVLVIAEPVSRNKIEQSSFAEKLQIVFLFICCAGVFVSAYALSSVASDNLKEIIAATTGNSNLAGVAVEFLRLLGGLMLAVLTAWVISMTPLLDFGVVKKLYLEPVIDFFSRYGLHTAFLLLSLICLYRISDIVLGVISNVFYYDIGFSKNEIASVSKVFGLMMTLAGGFIGGLFSIRFGVMKILLAGAILSALTNLLFMALAETGYNLLLLYGVIGADNLCAGIASAAFVAFLSSLTNIRFTAMQYAIFSSIMTLLPKILGGYSGSMVNSLGYSGFFLVTAVIGIPVIILILVISRDSRFS